jgi:hypothetical protein
MKRGQRPSAEQVVLTLRQIEVQTAQGKSIAIAQLRRRTSLSKVTTAGARSTVGCRSMV